MRLEALKDMGETEVTCLISTDDEQMARMESEMESLQREYRLIEENYGRDVLNLTRPL